MYEEHVYDLYYPDNISYSHWYACVCAVLGCIFTYDTLHYV